MNSDFRDLLAALNAADARYLVVGGYALALHAEPRFTKDLSKEDLAAPELVYQLGIAPSRVDILTSIDGVTFPEAWPNRVEQPYGGEPAFFIGFEDLLRNKRASGRPQDLADVELLEKHRRR
jgi:hypothetical protein